METAVDHALLMPLTTIATVSMPVVYDPDTNLTVMLGRIRDAAELGADLVVFPEQALQGYLTDTLSLDFENVRYQQQNAETVPNGPRVSALIEAAVEQSLHVVFGLTERDDRFADVLYNTVVLAGPDGYIGRYRKVHQPGDEKHVYHPGAGFPVFETGIGRIGMLICYDKCFPETTRALALQGAEILVMPTAWAYDDAAEAAEDDVRVDQYTLFGRVRALENQAWMVESNVVTPQGNLNYHGHSRIIDPNGVIRADTGPTEGIACVTVDVEDTILRARGIDYIGYHFLKDYVPVPATVGPYGAGTE